MSSREIKRIDSTREQPTFSIPTVIFSPRCCNWERTRPAFTSPSPGPLSLSLFRVPHHSATPPPPAHLPAKLLAVHTHRGGIVLRLRGLRLAGAFLQRALHSFDSPSCLHSDCAVPVLCAGRSPIFADFSQNLAGLVTIRAYGDQDRFCTKNRQLIQANLQACRRSPALRRGCRPRPQSLLSFLHSPC